MQLSPVSGTKRIQHHGTSTAKTPAAAADRGHRRAQQIRTCQRCSSDVRCWNARPPCASNQSMKAFRRPGYRRTGTRPGARRLADWTATLPAQRRGGLSQGPRRRTDARACCGESATLTSQGTRRFSDEPAT